MAWTLQNRGKAVDVKEKSQPYLVEVDETSSQRGLIITLAVNATTVVRCPYTPLNVGFGNDFVFDYDKFKDGGPGFYLRPMVAGVVDII
ncbi:MAG: hypothetical protein AB1489_42525 [Acidobacteriota bacterium]